VDIKRHPVAYLTHRAIDAMIDLTIKENLVPADIETIRLRTGPSQLRVMRNSRPQSALEAKFSLQFVLAAAVAARRISLAELTDTFVRDIADLTARVQCVPNGEGESNSPLSCAEEIFVRLKSGTEYTVPSARYPKGNWKNPLDMEDFRSKFLLCSEISIPKEKSELLYNRLMNLDNCNNIKEIQEGIL
jgi:2-methylcitrate dehydratase PrpD